METGTTNAATSPPKKKSKVGLVIVLGSVGFIALLALFSSALDSKDLNANLFRGPGTVRVVNQDNYDWHEVEIEVNDTWKKKMAVVPKGSDFELKLRQFTNDAGERCPMSVQVNEVMVSAKEGFAGGQWE